MYIAMPPKFLRLLSFVHKVLSRDAKKSAFVSIINNHIEYNPNDQCS